MLLDIEKEHLRIGMYIEAVQCPEGEFRKKRFVLKSRADLEAILATSARKVQINTARGQEAAREPLNGQQSELIQKSTLLAAKQLSATLTDIADNNAIDIEGLQGLSSLLGRTVEEAPDLFLKMTRLKTKDTVTYLHSVVVSALMMRVGQIMELDLETVQELGLAGLVHDVGKLSIEDSLLKKPGALQADEKEQMRKHPQIGYDLLKATQKSSQVMLEVCLFHHELLDGSGYPYGIKSTALPLHCRIAAVCDVFEALTSARPYKRPWSAGQALTWLYDQPDRYDYRIVSRLHEGIMPKTSQVT